MEDKEVLENYDNNNNEEIKKFNDRIDSLKKLISENYKAELLSEIEKVKSNFENLKDTPNLIENLKLEIKTLKEKNIPDILIDLEGIINKKFEDLENNEINGLKEKYETIENNSNLAKENSDKIQDLKLETDNLKTSILKELGEKINDLDEKYFGTIENLKNNEISKLDTKYSEVLGKFDNLKDDIIREKDERIDDKEKELQEIKKYNIELNQKLEKEIENTKNQAEILNEKIKELEVENNSNKVNLKALEEQMKLKEEEIERKASELKEINILNIELNQKIEAVLKDKEYQVHNLKEKMEREKIENESLIGELKIKLNNFYEKIEKPYENLLKAITESTKADTIGNYLGFNNEKGLSKSMILFALASDDNLARRIALFYSERKEIMVKEDFRIVKEVNNIYVNKPWGILYAEAEGTYQSSLVKDRKSSSIYKNFTVMYSPAYRPDENGNSPIKGIVDGK